MKRIKWILLLAALLLALTACNTASPVEETTEATTAETTVETTVETTAETTEATEPAAVLQPGYYLLESMSADGESTDGDTVSLMRMYVLIREDGTGLISMMGSSQELVWTGTHIGDMPYTLEADRLSLETDGITMVLRCNGDILPEEYLSQLPVGYFVASSVGVDGNVNFYGTIDPENGWLRLEEDGSGRLYWDGAERDFRVAGENLVIDGVSVPFVYMPAAQTGDTDMIALYFMDSNTSVILRRVEENE